MDVMAAHHTMTSTPTLFEKYQELKQSYKEQGIVDPYGHKAATLIYYKYIEDNSYYEKIYNDFIENTLKHDEDSLKVQALIKEMGYKYFVRAFDKVIKLDKNGKTENFPKGR